MSGATVFLIVFIIFMLLGTISCYLQLIKRKRELDWLVRMWGFSKSTKEQKDDEKK